MRDALQLAQRAAESRAAVLLLGEIGTGKEQVAEAIHRWSPRANEPYVRVHCATQPDALLERLLFGDSSAGGGQENQGALARAHRGTLYLEDVHAVPAAAQIRLLTLLQEGRFERLGDPGSTEADVRIIAATSRDLQVDVIAGAFREDLFWRLNVVPIHLPPLRRRREDIQPLVEFFVRECSQANGRTPLSVSSEAMQLLIKYGWPANARELRNCIERAVVLAESSVLSPELLPGAIRGEPHSEMAPFRGADPKSLIAEFVHNEIASANGAAGDLHARIVSPVERELIVQIMRLCNNVQKKAADQLGMNRNTLHKKLKEHKIE